MGGSTQVLAARRTWVNIMNARRNISRKFQRNLGQSTVEFVLALPLLLLFLVSIIYFGRLFLVKQALACAAQEGARAAARLPNLSDPASLDLLRGFTTDGACSGDLDPATNVSPIYRALSAARLLAGDDGSRGSLPSGARVIVSPYDDGQSLNSDRVTVTIEYPFGLFFNPRTGTTSGGEVTGVNIAMTADPANAAVPFGDVLLSESAAASQEVYQQ